tara:strand:- start:1588 stop:2877 length:1290 start_codon:yes stop_codon:yes gene_type:complete
MKISKLSQHYKNRSPSAIRNAQMEYSNRIDKDSVEVINLAIGNISLPMYPAMLKRMREIGRKRFADGVVGYTPTVGNEETRKAFLNILQAEGINTSNIYPSITDGGSSAMELMMLGVCGPASKNPIMLLDPVYTNYLEFAKRLAIKVITTSRNINDDGSFASINIKNIEFNIKKHKPNGLVVIPYDNPTGQFLTQNTLNELAKICVKSGIWLISDEAYRPLHYKPHKQSSIWLIDENTIPGITGRRISIESSSKIWNACGLRIGALLTDNNEFHQKAVSEYTANLCANAIGQEIFGALATEPHEKIQNWYKNQRYYYQSILLKLKKDLKKELPGLIISEPEAALYCIVDFKKIADSKFDSLKFVEYCAKRGKIKIKDKFYTLLLATMDGFYSDSKLGNTQLRIAIVETPEKMLLAPKVLSKLFFDYTQK